MIIFKGNLKTQFYNDKKMQQKAYLNNISKPNYAWISYLIIIVILTLIIRHFNFIADDLKILKAAQHNPFPFFSDWENTNTGMYRPIIILSYYVNFLLFKFHPFPYYLFNILLHLISTIILYKILVKLLKLTNKNEVTINRYSFITSLVFLILPQNLINVYWIAGRNDLICGFFVLLSILCFIVFIDCRKKFYFEVSLFLEIFAFMSKETALVFGFYMVSIYIFYLLISKKKVPVLFFIPHVLIILLYVLFRYLIFGHNMLGKSEFISSNFFEILKYIFYGFWALFIPLDVLDYIHLIVVDNWFMFVIISIVLFLLLFSVLYSLKKSFVALSYPFLIIILSYFSLIIYVGNYPQMRLIYAHIPLLLLGIVLFLIELRNKLNFKRVFLLSYFFILLIGVNTIVYRIITMNNYYEKLNNILPTKEEYDMKNHFIFLPYLGRISQSWVDPDIKLMESLNIYNNLNSSSEKITKIISYSTYSCYAILPSFIYTKINDSTFIMEADDNYIYAPRASKKFVESAKTINYFNSHIHVTPLDEINIRPGKSSKIKIELDKKYDWSNVEIFYPDNGDYKKENVEQFMKGMNH